MPAGMVLVAWSKEFDVWPARVWDPGLCYFFCNFFFKKIPYKDPNDFQINNEIMFYCV